MRFPIALAILSFALLFGSTQAIANSSAQEGQSTSIPLVMHNFVLSKDVTISNPYSLSASEGGQFIPQFDHLLSIYFTHIENGEDPIQAILLTYSSPDMSDLVANDESVEY